MKTTLIVLLLTLTAPSCLAASQPPPVPVGTVIVDTYCGLFGCAFRFVQRVGGRYLWQ